MTKLEKKSKSLRQYKKNELLNFLVTKKPSLKKSLAILQGFF